MRRLLVKLFNLVYLAGAVLSIVALCIKPMINTNVSISLTPDEVADRLVPMFESKQDEAESKALVRAPHRASYKVTRDTVKNAFPDGFNMDINIKISAKYAFAFKNKTVLTELTKENIENSLLKVISSVSGNMKILFEDVTQSYAKEELEIQLQNTINQYFDNAKPVQPEEVDAVYNNVKENLSNDEPVSVEDLANVIVGAKNEDGTYQEGTLLYILNERQKEAESKYVVVDPKPSKAEVDAEIAKGDEGKYFVKTGEDTYTRPANSDDYATTTYYKKGYDDADISGETISEKLAAQLNSIPGLVDVGYTKSSPTEEAFNKSVMSNTYYKQNESLGYEFAKEFGAGPYFTASFAEASPTKEQVEQDVAKSADKAEYFVLDNDNYVRASKYDESLSYFLRSFTSASPTESEFNATVMSNKYYTLSGEDTYTLAKTYDKDVQYYVYGTYVNDIDTALAKFIEAQTNNSNKASLRTRDESLAGEKSQQEIEDALKEYLYSVIPFQKIYDVTAKFDGYAAYALFGLIALFAFPWFVFGLLTLCRTLRRRKIWTRPWVVFVFAFPQLILGIVLTYGWKYIYPILAGKIPQLAKLSNTVNLDIRTGCLIPSFVYCGFIVMSLFYPLLTRKLKVRYKQEQRVMIMQHYEELRKQRERGRRRPY